MGTGPAADVEPFPPLLLVELEVELHPVARAMTARAAVAVMPKRLPDTIGPPGDHSSGRRRAVLSTPTDQHPPGCQENRSDVLTVSMAF
jgi:hypothetical protein